MATQIKLGSCLTVADITKYCHPERPGPRVTRSLRHYRKGRVPTRRVDADSNAQQLFANVGSYYPLGKNFRLTPEVKAKFTEKLRRDPTEFDGI